MTAARRLFLLLILCGACSCSSGDPEPTLGEWFRDTHEHTNTPYGRPVTDSVRVDGDAVVFETEDGTTVRQEYQRSGDGAYRRVGDPVVETAATAP